MFELFVTFLKPEINKKMNNVNFLVKLKLSTKVLFFHEFFGDLTCCATQLSYHYENVEWCDYSWPCWVVAALRDGLHGTCVVEVEAEVEWQASNGVADAGSIHDSFHFQH